MEKDPRESAIYDLMYVLFKGRANVALAKIPIDWNPFVLKNRHSYYLIEPDLETRVNLADLYINDQSHNVINRFAILNDLDPAAIGVQIHALVLFGLLGDSALINSLVDQIGFVIVFDVF